MKDIPIIFPISLVVIILLTFLTGAYAISENALDNPASIYAASINPVDSVSGPDLTADAAEHTWYQGAAIWICPLH